jgi:predicted nuclease with TOPRIM domain
VLTHIKEKLQFVSAENSVVREKLAELESSLAAGRDRLTRAKRERESLRNDSAALKQSQGFSNRYTLKSSASVDTKK